jgi:hypothetical protein
MRKKIRQGQEKDLCMSSQDCSASPTSTHRNSQGDYFSFHSHPINGLEKNVANRNLWRKMRGKKEEKNGAQVWRG